ncbi:MAG: Dabb family protein [Parasporobacterium sp.]|nr:Dabb family protein [Parasporobacterium sp.]
MVKHIIIWTLKEEFKIDREAEIKAGIKEGLEGLKGKIPGLLDIKVNTDPLPGSSGDLMLDSTFKDEESLKGYRVHPAHVETANTRVRPFTAGRACMDYELN